MADFPQDARCFVDTNVLVYAMDNGDPRGAVARELIAELMRKRLLCTSTQVLQELYVTLTRKGGRTLPHKEALRYADKLASYPVVGFDYSVVRAAAELSSEHVLSFWDALIVTAAARSGAKYLFTEDLQNGRRILGIQIVNPFKNKS